MFSVYPRDATVEEMFGDVFSTCPSRDVMSKNVSCVCYSVSEEFLRVQLSCVYGLVGSGVDSLSW